MSRATATTPAAAASTVSICVNDDEHKLIRDAAAAASLSVSSWGATRLAAGIASPAARKGALAACQTIAATFAPKGSRKGRVSMVISEADHIALKTVADKARVSPHALCQAIALDAAGREVAAMPAPVRREIDATRAVARSAGTTLIALPSDLADVDPDDLADMLAKLISATAAKILDGTGRAISAGVVKMAASLAGVPMVTVKVRVPELHFTGPAFVLDVPAAAYATTLATKAARVLIAAQ